MTSPITPPPELVQQWASEWIQLQNVNRDNFMATRAAQWGADQELEACCEWLSIASNHGLGLSFSKILPEKLRAARRPKPPSLKQLALEGLTRFESMGEFFNDETKDLDTIRRALEALPDE